MAQSVIKGRHWIYIWLFLFLFLFAILTRETIWMYWTVLNIFVAILFITDVLFSDQQFVFDPDTNNWRRKTDPQY